MGADGFIAAATLPRIVERFARQYPGVVLNVEDIDLRNYPPNVRELGFDLVLTRLQGPGEATDPFNDLSVEVLFEDQLVVAAGAHSQWAHRRKVDIADLADEPWILSGPNRWNYKVVAEAFRMRGARMPKVCMKTLSVHLQLICLPEGNSLRLFRSWSSISTPEALDLKFCPWLCQGIHGLSWC